MMYKVFSARAACEDDVEAFASALARTGCPKPLILLIPYILRGGVQVSDVKFELRANGRLELEFLRQVLRSAVSSPVILQTLRPLPLEQNSLYPDLSLEIATPVKESNS